MAHTMTDWESRMADKARAREQQRLDAEEVRRAEDEAEWHTRNDSTVDAYVSALAADIPVDEVRAYAPHACACVGPPPELWHLSDETGAPPCMCALYQMAIEARSK